MTHPSNETAAGQAEKPQSPKRHNNRQKPQANGNQAPRQRPVSPILQKLIEQYPAIFGAAPIPLKRGIFEDLQQAHPEINEEELKQALGEHTRSTRYLHSVAAGQGRHDLQAQPVEPMALEHTFHAIVEIFRRKQKRGNAPEPQKQEAREWLARRLHHHIDASGLAAADYCEKVSTKDPVAKAVLEEVSTHITERNARDEAMLRAFETSQTSIADFAEMYGLTTRDAGLVLARARLKKQAGSSTENN